VLRAMRAGKHVVSANKLLLSQHGEELWGAAREHGVQLRFEAAVAGVVPVIRVLQESLAAAHVERIHGIVNGTTNYILTEMARGGLSYEAALARAQELGYAEADPTDDVTGATPRRRWRSSRDSRSTPPCTSTRSATRASST
jgi:homoserine dehydrogenase